MAKTSPEKLAAALRANLARRKTGTAVASPKSPKSPQNPGPQGEQSPAQKTRPGPKPA